MNGQNVGRYILDGDNVGWYANGSNVGGIKLYCANIWWINWGWYNVRGVNRWLGNEWWIEWWWNNV